MTVSKKIKIPFHLCDPAQVMFFGSLYEIYHMFLEENISQFGISWNDWFLSETPSPIRGLSTDYSRPLLFGEDYTASLKVQKVGDSTVTFVFDISLNKKIHAITEITHCFINKKTVQKSPIPKLIKQELLKHLCT